MKRLLFLLVVILGFFVFKPSSAFAVTCYTAQGGTCSGTETNPANLVNGQCPTTIPGRSDIPVFPSLNSCQEANNIPTATPDPNAPTVDTTTQGSDYTLTPPLKDITDHTFTVSVDFKNLEGSGPFYVCLESDMCIDNDGIREGIANGDDSAIDKSTRMSLDDVDEGTLMRYKLVGNKIEVCGDGSSKLKAVGNDKSHDYYQGRNNGGDWWGKMKNHGCDDKRDYFHPGKVYILSVYTKADLDGKEGWTLLKIAGFYVNHEIPVIGVNPINNITPGSRFNFELSTQSIVPKNGPNTPQTQNRNNYQVLVEGPGLSARKCGYFDKDHLTAKFTLPAGSGKSALLPGNVKITISEQINESDDFTSIYGRAIAFTDEATDIRARMSVIPVYSNADLSAVFCQGGFVYRIYNCTVSENKEINSCKAYKDPTDPSGKNFNYFRNDPNGVDLTGLLNYFDKLGVNSADPELPCNIGSHTVKNPSDCKNFTTALGEFPVDPIGFISKLFSVVLSLAGLGAIITIVYSGWRILLSRGDKEKLQAARDRLTSAIVGLLFIIFSLALLSVIGGDILKIPGFG